MGKDLGILLMESVNDNNVQEVKRLIELGADVTVDNNYPIRKAATNGNIEIVKMLIAAGADVAADKNYAVFWAVMNKHYEVAMIINREILEK